MQQDIQKRFPLLTADEEKRLGRIIRQGGPEAKAARQRFVESNLRLVLKIALGFHHDSMSYEDLVQEGNIGLMKAVEKFDPEVGTRFSTYASWWIRQAIARAIHTHGEPIRIPSGCSQERDQVRQIQRYLHNRLQRSPTIAEIAAYLNMSEKKVSNLLSLPRAEYTLDEPTPELEDSLRIENIVDRDTPSLEDTAITKELANRCPDILKVLPVRSQRMLQMRFDVPGASLESIGQTVGLTRERVRQVLNRDLRRIRRHAFESGLLPKNGTKVL